MRTTGRPTSSNGASSHHLQWDVSRVSDPIVEVSVGFEVLEPPRVDRLWFWALQVSFADSRSSLGGAHLGLQHHPSYPDAGAVCWGGYHDAATGRSGELPGGPLFGPSSLRNPNVANYRWSPGVEYRLHVSRVIDGWAGTIIDTRDQLIDEVRVLHCDGDRLVSPMVWTECFADCDAPPTAVRWSDLTVISNGHKGRQSYAVQQVSVNYQRESDGGCSTSDSSSTAADGLMQRTGVERSTRQGAVLPVWHMSM